MNKLILVLVFALAGICGGYPEPAAVQAPGEWTFNVVFEQPEQIQVNIPGVGVKRFWYLIITVQNSTGRDAVFFPKCELMTDTFQIIQANKSVPGIVFGHIKRRHHRQYPFLESLEHVDNRILQGRDNRRDIAIIWPDFDQQAKNIKLFIAGLSNETAVIEHPTITNEDGEPKKIYLQKTLSLEYAIPGDPRLRSQTQLIFKDKNWIMR